MAPIAEEAIPPAAEEIVAPVAPEVEALAAEEVSAPAAEEPPAAETPHSEPELAPESAAPFHSEPHREASWHCGEDETAPQAASVASDADTGNAEVTREHLEVSCHFPCLLMCIASFVCGGRENCFAFAGLPQETGICTFCTWIIWHQRML